MANTKLDTLIRRLIEKTESLELRWNEGARHDTYEVSFPRQTIIVEYDQASILSGLIGPSYSMRVLDERGQVAVNLADEISASVAKTMLGESKIKRLFEAAQRSSRHSGDRVVDDLLAQLR